MGHRAHFARPPLQARLATKWGVAALVLVCLCVSAPITRAQQQTTTTGEEHRADDPGAAAAVAGAAAVAAAATSAPAFELAPPLFAASGGPLPNGAQWDLGDPRRTQRRREAATADTAAVGGDGEGSSRDAGVDGTGAEAVAAASADADADAVADPASSAGSSSSSSDDPAPPGMLFTGPGGVGGRKPGDIVPGRFIVAIGPDASAADALDG